MSPGVAKLAVKGICIRAMSFRSTASVFRVAFLSIAIGIINVPPAEEEDLRDAVQLQEKSKDVIS